MIQQFILEKIQNQKILKSTGYIPHPKQLELLNDNHRYKVVRCGRRFGKTVWAVNKIINESFNKKGDYWFVAPTYRQAKEIAWRMFEKYLPRELILKRNETELSIDLVNGSRISLKGCDNPDSLRGVGLDGVVMDEWAFSQPYAWTVTSPILQDRDGWAVFISTPDGYNHFYEMYNNELKDPDYKSFHFTSYDNPYLKAEELDKERERMSTERFAQEYEAEFMRRTGAIWPSFKRDIHVVPKRQPSGTIYGSIDFGFAVGHETAVLWHEVTSEGVYTFDGFDVSQTNIDKIDELMKGQTNGLVIQGIFPDPARPDLIEELKKKNWPILETKKDVELGIAKVDEYMQFDPITKKPKWTISDHLQEAIKQIEQYVWMEVRGEDGKFKQIPRKEADNYCFGAGAKILTDKGQIDIEKLDKTYKVWTPFGWSKINDISQTGTKEVVDFYGTKVTPNHKILTQRGFVPIDTLRYFDIISICTKQYTLNQYHIGDTQIRQKWNLGGILCHLFKRGLEANINYFTEQSGKVSMGIIQKVMIYITSMATLLTTLLKTWFVLVAKNIKNLIQIKTGNQDLKKQENQQRYGINQMKVENGIEKMVKNAGLIGSILRNNAKLVDKNTQPHFQPVQSSADSIVKCMHSEDAGGLNKLKLRKLPKRIVYNLSTQYGCYFANGFLVSNCDSLRYFIFNYLNEIKKKHHPILGYTGGDPTTGFGRRPIRKKGRGIDYLE